jgi:hypothetical protein
VLDAFLVQSDLKSLPTSDELPCSDDTPVDNEDQSYLPNFLLFLLASVWSDLMDWFFGIGLGIGWLQREVSGIQLELLYWYNESGVRYLAADELEQQERQRAEQERAEKQRLLDRLRAMGIDPDKSLN